MAAAAKSKSGKPKACQPKACPICGKPSIEQYRPFCSRRCADVDLNRWLSGVYAVPVAADEEDEELPPAPSENSSGIC